MSWAHACCRHQLLPMTSALCAPFPALSPFSAAGEPVRELEARSLGSYELKGVREPMELMEVAWAGVAPSTTGVSMGMGPGQDTQQGGMSQPTSGTGFSAGSGGAAPGGIGLARSPTQGRMLPLPPAPTATPRQQQLAGPPPPLPNPPAALLLAGASGPGVAGHHGHGHGGSMAAGFCSSAQSHAAGSSALPHWAPQAFGSSAGADDADTASAAAAVGSMTPAPAPAALS